METHKTKGMEPEPDPASGSHCQFARNSQDGGPCSTAPGVCNQQNPDCGECYRSDGQGCLNR